MKKLGHKETKTGNQLLILQTISIMKLFTTIENMTGGGPGNATANLPMMLYDYAFSRYQMGYASAIAMVLFALILIFNEKTSGLVSKHSRLKGGQAK